MSKKKYYLKCVSCGNVTSDFGVWFENKQVCTNCGSKHSEVWYNADYQSLVDILKTDLKSFWGYLPFLPLTDSGNIISCTEGGIPLQQWSFLEEYAKRKFNLDIDVFVYRNDLNGGTGTFKDVAASLAASIFKEHKIEQYCVASTGNTATSYAAYLSIAGINCSVFLPECAIKASEAFISAYVNRFSELKEIILEQRKLLLVMPEIMMC